MCSFWLIRVYLGFAACFGQADTGCSHCGRRCWMDNEYVTCRMSKEAIELHRHPRKTTFKIDEVGQSRGGMSMADADKGLGALYIIMDAVRRRRKMEEEERKEEEGEGDEF